MIVDSHCHVSPIWYEPVESLLAQMDRTGVQQAVLVQLLGQYDNGYLLECRKRYPRRFAVVAAVDPSRPDAVDTVRRLADSGAAGIRLRPAARSPGSNPLAVWEAVQECGLSASSVGNSQAHSSPEFGELVAALPRLPIVLEHFGGTSQADANEEQRNARRSVFSLARHSNVFLKLPGLGELLPRAQQLPSAGVPLDLSGKPILSEALQAFGARRMMWGSDFPVVASREGYSNALHWCQAALESESATDITAIFGGTARSVYKLG